MYVLVHTKYVPVLNIFLKAAKNAVLHQIAQKSCCSTYTPYTMEIFILLTDKPMKNTSHAEQARSRKVSISTSVQDDVPG
jgi:hypothetical protein